MCDQKNRSHFWYILSWRNCSGCNSHLNLVTFTNIYWGIFLPELASQTLFSLTPGQVESQAVESLGPIAKYSAFIGAVIANLVLYGLIGLLFTSLLKKNLSLKGYLGNVLRSSLVAYVILLVVGILLLILTETDIQTKLNSIMLIAIFLIPSNIAFGFILSYFYENIIILRDSSTLISKKETTTVLLLANQR